MGLGYAPVERVRINGILGELANILRSPDGEEPLPPRRPPLRLVKLLAPYAYPFKGLAIKGSVAVLSAQLLSTLQPLLFKVLFDELLPTGSVRLIGLTAIGFILLTAVSGFLNLAAQHAFKRFQLSATRSLYVNLLRHILSLPLVTLSSPRRSTLISAVQADVFYVENLLGSQILVHLTNIVRISLGVITLSWIDWHLTLLSAALLPVLFAFSKRFRNSRRWLSYRASEAAGKRYQYFNEMITGAKVTKAFGREEYQIDRLRMIMAEMDGYRVSGEILDLSSAVMSSTLSKAATIGLICTGAIKVFSGELTLGSLVSFYAYLVFLYGPIEGLVSLRLGMEPSLVGLERIEDVLNLTPESASDGERERRVPQTRAVLKGGAAIKGGIRFESVSFSHTRQDRKILNGVSFSIDPGEVVAIVGESGVGKTTLIDLISGFYDPTEGEIYYDGRRSYEVGRTAIRRSIGYVLQEPFLFDESILENIRYGAPNASVEEIHAVAMLAGAHRFITGLPGGYLTIAGERGAKLSLGERQRITIARALLRNPQILILDEATASLDLDTESGLKVSLLAVMRNRTTIIVSHRPSTIAMADRLIVLSGGEIIADGPRDASDRGLQCEAKA